MTLTVAVEVDGGYQVAEFKDFYCVLDYDWMMSPFDLAKLRSSGLGIPYQRSHNF